MTDEEVSGGERRRGERHGEVGGLQEGGGKKKLQAALRKRGERRTRRGDGGEDAEMARVRQKGNR